MRPAVANKVQPFAQFLAAFPANVVFPIAVLLLVAFNLNPNIWLSVLIIFGTQWYILFNVIAGAQAYPSDLKEAAKSFGIRGRDWWIKVMIPGIFPYYVTGALTASGGSWNAAIVAEYVKSGDHTEVAQGVGSYIAIATEKGNFEQIVLGVAVMSIFVIIFNRLLWRPLFGLAEKTTAPLLSPCSSIRFRARRVTPCCKNGSHPCSRSKTSCSAIRPAPARPARWCSITSR